MSIEIKTVFCDIDGVLFKHFKNIDEISNCEILPGVLEKFRDWHRSGYRVVLTSGRPSSLRRMTEEQLERHGICYHFIIMDLPRGTRIVINDIKPDSDANTAEAVNIPRNEGLVNVDI